MASTLVIQSHRNPLPFGWMHNCVDSVRQWAAQRNYDYRWLGDELFAAVGEHLLRKTRKQPVVATDLARLIWLQRGLAEGYDRVVWCDADFLIFDAQSFELPDADTAVGREVWVQTDGAGKLRSYVKVHNAFLMFARGNSFLDFYAETAARLLRLNHGRIPPQFIGPKLLTALHNIVQLPVMERAGMLSPPVLRDLILGGGPALDRLRADSNEMPGGVNLSASLCAAEGFTEDEMTSVIETLRDHGCRAPELKLDNR